jgi:hypothetical protein
MVRDYIAAYETAVEIGGRGQTPKV